MIWIIVLSFATPSLLSTSTQPPGGGPLPQLQRSPSFLPFFEPLDTNQSAQVGSNVFLPCRVKNLGNKSVTWLRSRDAHILTVDRYMFISDSRFALLHPSPNSFTLAIRHAQPRDKGVYECQITTSPKSSLLFFLDVVTPQTRILGGESDIFVKSGSSLLIKCVIYDALEEPEYVFWFLDGARLISFGGSGSVQNVERLSPDTTLATLTVQELGKDDGGNYTCAPRNLDSASVMVHVIGDSHPAASSQQQKSSPTTTQNSSPPPHKLTLYLLPQFLIIKLLNPSS